MKKTAVLIASVILSIFCSLPVFATGNNLPEEKTIGVFAKAVYTLPDGCYGAKKDNDGHYVVELPDGIKITLTSKSDVTSLRMVIFQLPNRINGLISGFQTVQLISEPIFCFMKFIL